MRWIVSHKAARTDHRVVADFEQSPNEYVRTPIDEDVVPYDQSRSRHNLNTSWGSRRDNVDSTARPDLAAERQQRLPAGSLEVE